MNSAQRKKIIYLASPYGFSKQQRERLLPIFVKCITDLGGDVWEPFQRNNQVDFSVSDWAYTVGQADKADIEQADGIFAIINGQPPDEGVMIELGMAIALKKPVFLFRDDFRKCTDSENYPLNLMIFSGLPRTNWRDYMFASIEEMCDNNSTIRKYLAASHPLDSLQTRAGAGSVDYIGK